MKLKHWITKRIVQKFNLPWAIFLDSDKNSKDEITENIKFVNKTLSNNNLEKEKLKTIYILI